MRFKGNLAKTIEVILLVSKGVPISKSDCFKLLLSIDINHLNKHARPVTGLNYTKEKNQVIPEEMSQLLKLVNSQYLSSVVFLEEKIIPKRIANLDYLSKSDIEEINNINIIDINKLSENQNIDLTKFIDNEEILDYLYEVDTLTIVI